MPPPDGDLQRQIDRLTTQVDRMSSAMDGAFLRKEVFVVETASARAEVVSVHNRVTAIEESMKWVWRTLILTVIGVVSSVAGAVLVARFLGG